MTITVEYKTQKNRWYPGLIYEADKDDVGDLVIDYSGELGTDTVSTVTTTANNITAGTPTTSANIVTIPISNGIESSNVKLEVKMTTTGSKTLSITIKFRVKDYYSNA
jgi:hypothetical protein